MSEPLCRDCLEQTGANVLAARILKSGPRCEMHYRQMAGMPPLSTPSRQEETSVPNKKHDVDKSAVQRDRDAGMASADLAKKYGVEVWWIYQNTKGSKSAGGGQKAPTPKKVRPQTAAAAPEANGSASSGLTIPQIIAALTVQLNTITSAIEALKRL